MKNIWNLSNQTLIICNLYIKTSLQIFGGKMFLTLPLHFSVISSLCFLLIDYIYLALFKGGGKHRVSESSHSLGTVSLKYISHQRLLCLSQSLLHVDLFIRKFPILRSFQTIFMMHTDLQMISSCFRKQLKGKSFIYFNFNRFKN